MKIKETIVEKKLGIPPDYQYNALRNSIWAKQNWHRNKFNLIKKLARLSKSDKVLDLGTGSGNFELLFSKRVKTIDGIDYNNEALDFLSGVLKRKKIKNVFLTCADMRMLPTKFDSKKFDLIVSVDTIEHITKKDGEKLLKWVKQRLNKGGKFIVITPNYSSAWTWAEQILDKLSFTPDMGTHQHLSKYTVSSMKKVLEKIGLSVEEAYTFNLFSFITPRKINDSIFFSEAKILGNHGCLMAITAKKL